MRLSVLSRSCRGDLDADHRVLSGAADPAVLDGDRGLIRRILTVVTIAIGIVSWTAVARITRAEFLRIRELEYVTASRAAGASNMVLMTRVILPNALPPIIVQAALMVGSAILFEAGLAFLGLSAQMSSAGARSSLKPDLYSRCQFHRDYSGAGDSRTKRRSRRLH